MDYNQDMAEENGLSERERDILRLVATGASNKEIAQTLVISPNTVKVHLRNIFAKIGVVSRTEATLYALRVGLIESPAATPITPEELQPAPEDAISLPAEENAALPWTRRLRWAGLITLTLVAIFAMVVFGGRALGLPLFLTPTPLNPVMASTASQPLNRWEILTALPQPLDYAAATVYETNLYLIAGRVDSTPSGAVYSYDTVAQKWSTLAAKPTPVSEVQAALLGEMIYVPGGLTADGKSSAVVERFDPRSNTWKNAAPLPAPRSAYALTSLEGKLYLFGGWDGQEYRNDLFIYDPAEDRWTQGSSMPYPAGDLAAVSSNGKIYLLGGTSDGTTPLDKVLAYYPQRDLDDEDPWETHTAIPQARYASAATALGDLIFLFGGSAGSDNSNLPGVQYRPQREEWSVLDDPLQSIGIGAAAVGLENYIYVFGPGITFQRYQAIYTITIPVIKK
ncbi:response regulator containing a CheY-like receiver domain and an HTH DNA-binding domain [Longilinea arvoryzae]|uniref:Response regulator containing a CheY-like receiver domain and an HTH DNA-binding domain n=1 Tax=Longilinea arvoryzae TaxID=360412 RepID=A0A0S7BID1_9CHLR|nr:kelch repeat-containing protein [Longilinea arvoryzae]GAP15353.1 response regulator containing a CheY-like receiver domain and an HTH DNA-binding domain [Longilinea arvoryzae]